MSDQFLHSPFPRKALIAIGALIGFSLIVVVVARLTGYNAAQAPDSPAVVSRDLRFVDGPGGTLAVVDATSGAKVAGLPPGIAGFVRGVLRATTRARNNDHVPADTPFRLARLADGRLTLKDLGTKRTIELNSFGPTNQGAFAAFLVGSAPAEVGKAPPAQAGQTGQTH